jgi:hypothetical protein
MQALTLLLSPYGLKAHQMRPQDYGEATLADLELPKADDYLTVYGKEADKHETEYNSPHIRHAGREMY